MPIPFTNHAYPIHESCLSHSQLHIPFTKPSANQVTSEIQLAREPGLYPADVSTAGGFMIDTCHGWSRDYQIRCGLIVLARDKRVRGVPSSINTASGGEELKWRMEEYFGR
ncbi:hypothetical protein Bpfe_014812 [Biomphalaria pfeifferi]|uniref:Uncharacterized protein n=1 Tax=Biomphalaria pfeifferi TaxID=112525 RepID=A0AAD8F9X8_BIOPF|nr:hypothetical protein Bpfe_014812 [Biomphalaria pfeifferi]